MRIGSIVIACQGFDRMAEFWQAALGYVPREPIANGWGVLRDPSGRGPNISLNRVTTARKARSRLHLDLYTPRRDEEVERLIALGARRYPWRYRPGADFVVLEDPGGNLFCVVQKQETEHAGEAPGHPQAHDSGTRPRSGALDASVTAGVERTAFPRLVPAVLPANPNYAAAVAESFQRQALNATLNATLAFVGAGEIHIEMPFATHLTQHNGYLHAGVIAALADNACGYAALSLAPPNCDVLAVEFKINLLAPARAERFVARGRVTRRGRTLTVAQADVFGVTSNGEELVAIMVETVFIKCRDAPAAPSLGEHDE